jgi:hypothetical protein
MKQIATWLAVRRFNFIDAVGVTLFCQCVSDGHFAIGVFVFLFGGLVSTQLESTFTPEIFKDEL